MNFYICEHCGKLIEVIEDANATLYCCKQAMTKIIPNTVDAAQEKHIPVGTIEGNQLRVAIGSVAHPMTDEHHISWVYIVQGDKIQRQQLNHTGKPEAVFTIDEGPVKIYAYCNLHGLWESNIER